MKMDKESLVKNRFWIGLIAFAPLWLLILLVALFSSGNKAAANARKSTTQGRPERDHQARRTNVHHAGRREAEGLEKQKDKVWAEAWKGQKDLMKWPDGIDNKTQLEAAAYFGDELSPSQRNQFRAQGLYSAQLPPEGMQNLARPRRCRLGKTRPSGRL